MYYYKYKTKIGDLYISADDKYILSIHFSKKNDFIKKETPLIKETIKQINEYLNKERTTFDLPILITGTKFQQDIYRNLLKVGYGETISYKGLGETINKGNAARAVGGACNKNPHSIVVPCHRVISSSNDLTGYGGGLDTKIDLLKLEGIVSENGKVIVKNN